MSGPKFVGNLVALELGSKADLFDLAAAEVDGRTTVQDLRLDSGIKSAQFCLGTCKDGRIGRAAGQSTHK